MKKIALITGANKGIGFETARQLGKLDFTVLVSARDEARGNEAVERLKTEDVDAELLLMDPTDADSVSRAAERVSSKFGRLDVLIHNAGTFSAEDFVLPSEVPTSVLKSTYELNVFAVHEITRAFWSLLNKSDAARLVTVSSALGSLKLHEDGVFDSIKTIAYNSSKAAANMLTVHYAFQWKDTPHRANTIHPGSVKTDMNPNGELTVEVGAKTSVQLATIPADGPNGGFFHLGETLPW